MGILGFKNLFKGVIFTLIVVVFSGCAQKQIYNYNQVDVSTKFYAVKKSNKRDLTILKDLLTSQDNKEKYGVLIGGYYFKIGEYEKAKEYLEKYYNIESKDVGINILKNYWLGNIYSKSNTYKSEMYFNKADSYKETSDYRYFLDYFCGKKTESFSDCKKREEIVSKIENDNATVVTEVNKIEQTVIETSVFNKQIAINLKSPEIINGLLYAIEKNKYNIKISQTDVEDSYSIVNKSLLVKDNQTINFAIDYKNMLDEASIDDWIIQSRYALIVINDRYIAEGEYMKSNLDLFGIDNKVINFESGNLKYAYNSIVTIPEIDNVTLQPIINNEELIYPDNITFVAIGDYETVMKMIPYVRYISANPDNVKIVLITDMIDAKILDDDYYPYFKGVRIYTATDAINSKITAEFENGYAKYYGSNPDVNQFIGYDMIQFIMNQKDYLTSIVEVEDNKVNRKPICIIINKKDATDCRY
ncbi:hypothetical protein DSN97_03550 [Deferribacteraceae bacterium V6Fe1]|nr:hypothetical protein DSN97_03550 [Deferribacteraceae bacterium V6Fe1]